MLTSPPMTVYQMRTRKFADDADRRAHWAAVYANHDFVEGFATAERASLSLEVPV